MHLTIMEKYLLPEDPPQDPNALAFMLVVEREREAVNSLPGGCLLPT